MRTGCFTFKKMIFPYMVDDYNNTMNNERAVEVPIILHLYNGAHSKIESGPKVLEFGAVLPHYHPEWGTRKEERTIYPHLCIDLHEDMKGVLNKDAVLWNPSKQGKFDFIFSISTLEHVFDGVGRRHTDKAKAGMWIDMIKSIKSSLSFTGLMIITIPAFQPSGIGGGIWMNHLLNTLVYPQGPNPLNIEDTSWHPSGILKMNRMGIGEGGNRWREVDPYDSPSLNYNEEIPSAGTVFFLYWGNFGKFWL